MSSQSWWYSRGMFGEGGDVGRSWNITSLQTFSVPPLLLGFGTQMRLPFSIFGITDEASGFTMGLELCCVV